MQKYIIGFVIALIFVACTNGQPTSEPEMDMNMDVSEDVDFSTTQTSNEGSFVVELTPAEGEPNLNELTQWTLHIDTAEGDPVTGATVSIDGGMPEHNHGFPTKPVVTEASDGDYTVEGVRFHMAGWWEITFVIETDTTTDTVTFNVTLQ